MCSLETEGDRHRFAIGSNSAQASNEVHVVSFCEESNRIDCEHKFALSEIDSTGANNLDNDFENLTSQAKSTQITKLSGSPYSNNHLLVATQDLGGAQVHFINLPACDPDTAKQLDPDSQRTNLALLDPSKIDK